MLVHPANGRGFRRQALDPRFRLAENIRAEVPDAAAQAVELWKSAHQEVTFGGLIYAWSDALLQEIGCALVTPATDRVG